MDYNKIGYKDRKEAEYERNLEQFQRDNRTPSRDRNKYNYKSQKNFNTSDKKPVIEISDKGIKNSHIAQHSAVPAYENSGRKGRSNTKNIDNARKEE